MSMKRREATGPTADCLRQLDKTKRALLAALRETEGVDFSDDERELLGHSIGQVRARLDEIKGSL